VTPARRRLVALLLGLVAVYALAFALRPDAQALRDAIEPLGLAAIPAYVALATVLGTVLVPGALLATVAGLLFGPVEGVVATLAAAVCSAVVSLHLSRRVGREGVAEVDNARLRAAEDLLERRGVYAIVVQRLLPWVPDGPFNHAAGLLRVRTWAIVVGTLIGSLPRAVSYVVLGDALGASDTAQAVVGAVLLVATGALGLLLAAREVRTERRREPS
jgi:uncharacterized membrane protein YdjX (TVP38/TMEM64 family)